VLLTATPLQNSLMELYGLVSLVDDYAFGDAKSFRAQYARLDDEQFDELKDRLKPVCHRTLRRQVLEYIRYTNRIPITQEFVPTQEEQTLYDMVSDYLRRPSLQALPSSQRSLMTLIMRKLLASSTFAIAGALDTLARKLERQLGKDKDLREKLEQELSADYEEFEQTADEWGEMRLRRNYSPRTTSPISSERSLIARIPGFGGLYFGECQRTSAPERATRWVRQGLGAWECRKNDHLYRVPADAGLSRPAPFSERLRRKTRAL